VLVGASVKGADVEHALGFEWTKSGHERQYMLSKLVMDGRAAGVGQLISVPYANPHDEAGLRRGPSAPANSATPAFRLSTQTRCW